MFVAASGHIAELPSAAMNSRRRRQMLISPSLCREPYRGRVARTKPAVLTLGRGGSARLWGRGCATSSPTRRPPKARFGGPRPGRAYALSLNVRDGSSTEMLRLSISRPLSPRADFVRVPGPAEDRAPSPPMRYSAPPAAPRYPRPGMAHRGAAGGGLSGVGSSSSCRCGVDGVIAT